MITDVKELKSNLTLLTPNNEAEVTIDGIGCMSNLGDDNNGKQGNEGNLVLNNPSTSFLGDENSQQVVVEDGQSSLELVERHLNTHYDFRYNQVSGKVHFKKKDSNEYGNMTDYQFNSIVRELKKKQINVSKDTLNSVIHSDFVPAFNPFLDYFNGLPIWD
ncbi:hypothetical protein SIO70_02390 [Chitinophaga sancti]|uniref:hypothetical protein n=1 Tax=Chitinophaga sancti TaxID=1004 RepID=UPI002A75AF34|nr:hypothetical protein [Chitinophaga sancti]WPQ63707.1 hypothetical protein SIO70_02390 [Chitinophaga sancti]